MKNLSLLFIASCLLLIASCKKDSNTPAANNNNNNSTNPYYFKFTLNGTSYNLNGNFPQYISIYPNETGGYQDANGSLYPSAGLSFTWPDGDTVKESDLMGLVGKTLYFNDTSMSPHPDVSFDRTGTSVLPWDSDDTSNANYNVKVTSITFLKNDTTLGNPVRTYVITGTCNAVVSNSDSTSVFSAGSFHFIIARRDL